MKLALLTLACVVFAGCSGIADGIGDAVADKATEAILEEVEASISVKDAFADGLTHVYASFGQVALHKTSGEWVQATNEVGEIDLLALQAADAKAEIAKFIVPGGTYDTIRMKVLTLRVENAQGPVAATISSPFLEVPIDALIATQFAALIDFDLGNSFDDSGNFVPAIKNVQLSTNDADQDGKSDYDDIDDDNDGITDDQDADVNGDGKADAPVVKREQTTMANRIVGPSGFSWAGSKIENVEGEFARTGGKGAISFNTGNGMDIQSVYFYHDCKGNIDITLTLDQMDDINAIAVIQFSGSVPCGWHRLALGNNELWPRATAVLEITSNQGLGAISSLVGEILPAKSSTSTSSTSTSTTSSSTGTSTTSSSVSSTSSSTSASSSTTSSNPNRFRVEGEDTYGFDRAMESYSQASAGYVLRDMVAPNSTAWDFYPWKFTVESTANWGTVDVQITCNQGVEGLYVAFSDVDNRWFDGAEGWLTYTYDCGDGIRQYDLSSFGSIGPGEHELYMAYHFIDGAAAIDYIGFEYSSTTG